jgi:DNA topoisomerase-1
MAGRYGPYVKWGKVNATLPKGTEPETIDLDTALALIAAKGGKPKGKAARKSAKPEAGAKPKSAAKAKPAARAKAGAKPKAAAKPRAAPKARKDDPLIEG